MWEGLRSVGMVEAERTIGGETSRERRSSVTSLEADAKQFAEAVRAHWDIKNVSRTIVRLALGLGRGLRRGPEPDPEGRWGGEFRGATPDRAEPAQVGGLEAEPEPEAAAGGVGRGVFGQSAATTTPYLNAIALVSEPYNGPRVTGPGPADTMPQVRQNLQRQQLRWQKRRPALGPHAALSYTALHGTSQMYSTRPRMSSAVSTCGIRVSLRTISPIARPCGP